MSNPVCCVCAETLASGDAKKLGARYFCPAHHAEALRSVERPWWRSALLETAAVAGFVGLAFWLGGSAPVEAGLPVALALALPPAALLMVWVYRQDRVEAEPWGAVMGVFLLGALLGEAFALPVARDVFAVREWQHLTPTAGWVASLLVVAVLRQLSVFIAVRFTVFQTDEFDEPADGVVYAGAAGLGLATAGNIRFVLDSETVLPLETATHLATTCLLALAASAVLGYGLARRRLRSHPHGLYTAGAFAAAVALQGTGTELVTLAGIGAGDFDPLRSLAVALAVASTLLLAVDWLMSRLALEAIDRLGTEGHR